MEILVSYHEGYFRDFVDKVESYLKAKGHKTTKSDRECLDAKCYLKKDLVIVIGGDGTFLRTSHFNKDVPMLGINPNPKKKVGFFMQLNNEDFEEKLADVIIQLKTAGYFRLKVMINGKELSERILNEAYIGSEKPFLMFNYGLVLGKEKEFQRSSGILIGTPAGSHAWLKSAGGKAQKLNEKKIQYVIREPYEGKITGKFKLKKGIIEDTIKIVPKSPGILVIDSVGKAHAINADDIIEIFPAEELKYVKV